MRDSVLDLDVQAALQVVETWRPSGLELWEDGEVIGYQWVWAGRGLIIEVYPGSSNIVEVNGKSRMWLPLDKLAINRRQEWSGGLYMIEFDTWMGSDHVEGLAAIVKAALAH